MFIAIPVGMNYRTDRLPVVTLSLIGINTLIWLVGDVCFLSTEGESELWILQHLWLRPGDGTWYAWFTHMFVHADIFHLLGNMIYLFLFGSCVEDIIGRARFIAFYLLGGFIAALTYIGMSPEHFQSTTPMGGASGAISTCLGMYLLLRAGENIEFKYFFWFIVVYAGEFEVPAWAAISFWFASDLLFAVLGMFSKGESGGVAFGAHVGGLLAGVALIGIYKWHERRQAAKPAEPASDLIIDPAAVMARVNVRRTSPPTPAANNTSETPTIYLHDGHQQAGPFTLSRVQAMLHSGEVARDASYWSEGMDNWQSVEELAGAPM